MGGAEGKGATKLPLTLPEYRRIYEVIYSVLDGRANTPRACMFFAITGSLILNKHYRIAARPVAGAFLLCTDSAPSVLSIGRNGEGMVTSDREAFHMWVHTETHVIDFMAPIFDEAAKSAGNTMTIPRRMFQKPFSAEAASIDDLSNPGDYFTLPDPELSDHFVDAFLSRDNHTDLLKAADSWFKKHPKKMDDLSLMDDLGRIHKLTLSAPPISGAW